VFSHEKDGIMAVGCDGFIAKPYRASLVFNKLTEHIDAQFIYEATPELVPQKGRPSQQMLSPLVFEALPHSDLLELQQAAEEINSKTVREIVERIRPDHPDLAAMLDDLVSKYRFDRLQTLVTFALKKTQHE
jgi:two-component system sensor histidine kinase/response regulator